ncbi:MAG: autotransporter-associated beta strand repeat-containing protein [Bacteroidaceae bacterium]|nr:autotransporter-associated beta strand repeat-containing protein [Bacteroidaceae bacterium]
MTKRIIMTTVLTLTMSVSTWAQRIQQPLGRGVVVAQNGGNSTVTWRRLAQEPEGTTYNVYVNGRKVNASPLRNTNWQTTSTVVPVGSKVSVTLIDQQGRESEPSLPFEVKSYDMRNIFVSVNFEEGGSPLRSADFNTAFVWPIDLDGDGEYDYVVNRKSNTNGLDCYVEGYLASGKHLWTVKLGPNELSCTGQDDMITVADMDCDGLGDVVIQSSDGTQFWDDDTRKFGLYVGGKTTGDTDGDGIIDYETQGTRNAPRYISVIDGLTGREKAYIEQSYNQHYNRTNRSSLMGDEYNKHVGHMGVFCFDGIHPAVVMEWHMRGSGGDHHYYNLGVAYDFSTGTAGKLTELFNEPTGGPAFHQIRIGDVDGDGCDEMIVGGYTMNNNGKTLFNTGISHGDRFRTTDIDPEVPGLETFAIQQYAGDMLGQILYEAATGKTIKKWYLSGTGDVGRGECIDIDPKHLGWEMWSTMNGSVYDAKGDLISDYENQWPTEGIWWDADLDRETVRTSDSHYNVYVQDFFKGREVEFAKISGYRYTTVYAARAAFWGDIIGDWREELILLHKEGGVIVGFVGVTTDYPTTENRIYCLMEDPHYRGDCTTRGYYQSPNPGFYLGYDMPRPQLPPVMVTDLVQRSTDTYYNYMRTNTVAYQDGKSLLYDLYTDSNITLDTQIKPATMYMMPVKRQTINVSGTGAIAGNGDIWKSQQGTVSLDVPVSTTGTLYISEGTLTSTSTISSPVELRARGTLAGNATLEDTIIFEGALNYEGCRLMPSGIMTMKKGLNITRRVYVELNTPDDLIHTNGNLQLTGNIVFTINYQKPEAGRYKLIEYAGTFSGSTDKCSVRGLTGLSYNIVAEDDALWLVINSQRQPNDHVAWTGTSSNLWDYQTANFAISATATEFVAGDKVEFGDDAAVTSVSINTLMPTSGVTFTNDTKAYTFSGDGGFSGEGGLTFNGNGRVTLNTTKSDYTGATAIMGGTVVVSDLADGGTPSPMGAATTAAGNWRMGKATLTVNNSNASTNRALQITDSATINIPSGTTALKGQISGKGTLVKTGGGQLNITYAGANTYSGGTIIKGGTLAMGAWNTTFGTATSKILVSGNSSIAIFNNNTTSAVPSLQNKIEIEEGRTLTIHGGQRCSIRPTLTGKGTMKISFPYVRGDFAPNASTFEGVIEVTSGELRLAGALNMQRGTLRLSGGGYVYNNSGTHSVGALEGSNAAASITSGTWNIGYLGTDNTYAGTLASGITVNKYGDGRLTLTGSSAAPINVYAGTLDVENTDAPTTTGTITVRSGAMLLGSGQTGAVVVMNGGTIGASKNTMLTGSITLTSTLRVNSGGNIRVRGRGNTKSNVDTYAVAGTVTLTSPRFLMERLSGEWHPDEELKVFTGTSTINLSGTPTFMPERPLDGYIWDYSELQSRGVIRIVADPDADAISPVKADTPRQPTNYDITGRPISHPSKGLYIQDGHKIFVK